MRGGFSLLWEGGDIVSMQSNGAFAKDIEGLVRVFVLRADVILTH